MQQQNIKHQKIGLNDWDLSVGDGWTELVHEAINLVNEFNEKHPNNEFPINILDIKEKWGILQIDLDFYYEDLYDKIKEIELKSRNICEYCGSTKDVKTTSVFGWIKTLCSNCIKEEEDKRKKIFNKK